MRGSPVVAPYSPADNGTGSGVSRHKVSLSISKLRETAIRLPLGHDLGVSLRPALTPATACFICSGVASIGTGLTPGMCCVCAATRNCPNARHKASVYHMGQLGLKDMIHLLAVWSCA